MGFHVGSVVFWLMPLMRKHVENWIWYAVLVGLISMMSHRLTDILQPHEGYYLAPLTALFIALAAFFSIRHALYYVRRKVELENYIKALNDSLQNLQQELDSRGHVAENLAAILNDLREKIEYYEGLAREHQLPLYQDSASLKWRAWPDSHRFTSR